RSRTEPLQQQQRRKVAELAFISHREHGSESLKVDIGSAYLVMMRKRKLSDFRQRLLRMFFYDAKQCLLSRGCFPVYKIHDHALRFADNCAVGFADKVPHSGRMPMISACHARGIVHALLHYRPFAALAEDECVQIELESIGNGIVIHAGCQAADAHQSIAIQAGSACDGAQFLGSLARMPAASTADINAELVRARVHAALQCSEY